MKIISTSEETTTSTATIATCNLRIIKMCLPSFSFYLFLELSLATLLDLVRSDVNLAHWAEVMSCLEFSEAKGNEAAAADAAQTRGKVSAVV